MAANSGLGLPTRHFSGQFQLTILLVSFLIAPSSLSLKLLSERRRGWFIWFVGKKKRRHFNSAAGHSANDVVTRKERTRTYPKHSRVL
jgi:hypothetical protein